MVKAGRQAFPCHEEVRCECSDIPEPVLGLMGDIILIHAFLYLFVDQSFHYFWQYWEKSNSYGMAREFMYGQSVRLVPSHVKHFILPPAQLRFLEMLNTIFLTVLRDESVY